MSLIAEDVALELVRHVRAVVRTIERADRDLGRQIRRAASSVALNASEGKRRVGNDRVHLFRIAAGSADEVRTALRCAEAWGYVEASEIEIPLALIDRELRLLYGLTNRRRR
jgi:four helix bundle protein